MTDKDRDAEFKALDKDQYMATVAWLQNAFPSLSANFDDVVLQHEEFREETAGVSPGNLYKTADSVKLRDLVDTVRFMTTQLSEARAQARAKHGNWQQQLRAQEVSNAPWKIQSRVSGVLFLCV